jgi:hypothetical protein
MQEQRLHGTRETAATRRDAIARKIAAAKFRSTPHNAPRRSVQRFPDSRACQ